jgi:hypothetical protein
MMENPMTEQNRNGHLSNFEAYMPIKLTIEQIGARAVAFKSGDSSVYSEPAPTVLSSFETVDLVRYRLNSKAVSDAYIAIDGKHANCHDEHSYADRCARFGVIDRATGEPVALLWVIRDDDESKGYSIASVSFSKTRIIEKEEMLDVFNELDIPVSRRNGDDVTIIDRYDLWHENGEWVIREPQYLAVFRYKSLCFATAPPMEDVVSVYVPLHPDMPLDGGGDAHAAYLAKDHYHRLADQKFWEHRRPVQPGYSSWLGYEDPKVVKAAGHMLLRNFEKPSNSQQNTISPL